jgi:hypothetical protein
LRPGRQRDGELPLPLYGLAGPYSGDRFIEGEGWDLRTIVHRFDNEPRDLVVGVDRRATAQLEQGAPRVPISGDLARKGMSTALAASLSGVGDDVFEIAAEVANDGDAWRRQEVRIDDEVLIGQEREYEDMWIVYCLTPALIIHVLAPVALRLDKVELRSLEPEEVARRTDWPS